MADLALGSLPCPCTRASYPTRLIALTGGPGAGKTAVLEMALRTFCRRVAVLPEAASLIFSGGFPRHGTAAALRATQRAIFFVQREMERLVVAEGEVAVALCDRGTLDGLAYWPGSPAEFFAETQTSLEAELGRYQAIIHLETPDADHGYNHQNPERIESAAEAQALDARILDVWKDHPRRFVVRNADDFMAKAQQSLALIREELPSFCQLAPKDTKR